MTQIGLDDDGKARERFPAKYQLIPWDGEEETMRKNLQSVAYNPSLISDDLVAMRTRYANLQESLSGWPTSLIRTFAQAIIIGKDTTSAIGCPR